MRPASRCLFPPRALLPAGASFLLLMGLLPAVTGCQGVIAAAGGGGDDPARPGDAPPVDGVEAVDAPFHAPIRRLTATEYQRTVSHLFPGVTLPELDLLSDERVGAFDDAVQGQSASALAVERFAEAAAAVAAAAVADLDRWSPCDETTGADTVDCALRIAEQVARRAYRRPLDDGDEGERLDAFVRASVGDFGFAPGVEMVLTGLLESPFFLYRPELGNPAAEAPGTAEGAIPLTDYELATRLSYLLWDEMPDQELFDAAAAGLLQTDAGLEAQARRMMADERAREVLTGFLWDWLGLYLLDELNLDRETFPAFSPRLRQRLADATERYLEKALFEDDSYRSLLLGDYGFVDELVAPMFGVDAPAEADGLVLTSLDRSQRRGILSQPGFLAATSHGIGHSPILRGVKIMDRLLCSPSPPPPPEVLDSVGASDNAPEDVCTTRDHVSKTHTVGADCQSCHEAIDGTGFAFENYDALGRWRDEENGCAVDASGKLPLRAGDGEVAGPIDAIERMAASKQVAECFVAHWFRFALGREETHRDDPALRALAAELADGGDDRLQERMLALILSPSFRTLPAPAP